MSTRAMANQYMAKGGGGGGGSGIVGGGLSNLLANLLGQNNITGGNLTTTPEGFTTINPFQGSSGFFGGNSRNLAALYNAQMMPQVATALTQAHVALMNAQTEKEKQQIISDTQKEVANISGNLLIKNTQQQGQNTLQNTQQQGTNEQQLARVKGEEERKGINTTQMANWATSQGLPSSQNDYNVGQLNDPMVANLLARMSLQGNSLGSAGAQESSDMGTLASLREPAAREKAMLTSTTPMGGITTSPPFGYPIGAPSVTQGQAQQYVPMNMGGGMSIPYPAGVRPGTYTPGAIPPNLLQQMPPPADNGQQGQQSGPAITTTPGQDAYGRLMQQPMPQQQNQNPADFLQLMQALMGGNSLQ